MIEQLVDGRAALGSLWTGYIVLVHATAYAGGVALAIPFMRRAATQSAAHACLLVGMLLVTAFCWLPVGWWAALLPEIVSEPLFWLGRSRVAAGEEPGIAAVRIGAWVYITWMVGSAAMLLRLMVGWTTMAVITRKADRNVDAQWRATLREASVAMNTGDVTTLRFSKHVSTPMTWGTLNPEIILPLSAAEWSDEHRRMVLMHELAHVHRNDGLIQLIASVTRAIYWFHPLVIWSAGRLHRARETAADAMVLEQGVRRSAYASCLMRIADASPKCFSPVAIAMANVGMLETRVNRILTCAPLGHPRHAMRAMVLCGAVWMIVTGSVRLMPQRNLSVARLSSADWAMRGYAAQLLGRTRVAAIRAQLRVTAAHDQNAVVRRLASYGN